MPAKRTTGHAVQDEGTTLSQAHFLNFVGAGVSVATSGGVTTATISGGGGAEALQRNVTETGHGFTVGEVVMFDGSNWVLAQGDSAVNAEVIGLVAVVVDVNTFTLHYAGRITGLSGLTAGTVYFLSSATAGLLTATEPTDSGDVSKPLLVADSTTTGYFFNWRGSVNPPETGGDLLAWTNVTGGIGFTNGWSDLGAPYGVVAYAKDENFVYLRGLVTGAAANIGFTLPAGYRPVAQRLFYFVGAAAAGGVEITTGGAVTGFGSIPSTISFDSVSFSL